MARTADAPVNWWSNQYNEQGYDSTTDKELDTPWNKGWGSTSTTPDSKVPPSGQKQSAWQTGANVLGGLGSAAQGWAAFQNVGLTREANKDQRSMASRNLQAQAATIGNQVYDKAYRDARTRGETESEAQKTAADRVDGLGLPSHLSGKSFQWTRQQ